MLAISSRFVVVDAFLIPGFKKKKTFALDLCRQHFGLSTAIFCFYPQKRGREDSFEATASAFGW